MVFTLIIKYFILNQLYFLLEHKKNEDKLISSFFRFYPFALSLITDLKTAPSARFKLTS